MIRMILILILSANNKIDEQVNMSQYSTDTLPQKDFSKQIPMQKPVLGHKIYCSTYRQTKYEIIREANKITIISIYNEHRNTIHGIVKNGKIYSNDPNEKMYKQTGKFFLLKGNMFKVKNIENGEYYDYTLCK